MYDPPRVYLIISLFVVVAILFVIYIVNVFGETRPLPACINFNKPFYQHIHVSVKGIHIPALVGISYNCFREMHTHTDSGIIHIESNTPKNFTLGQFFEVWNKPTMGFTSLTINGKPATFDTVLKNGDKIVIKP